MTDAERLALTRRRLAAILALLVEDPDDEALRTMARRLTDVVRCHEFRDLVHRMAARLAHIEASVERRN